MGRKGKAERRGVVSWLSGDGRPCMLVIVEICCWEWDRPLKLQAHIGGK